jgi:hypothetical protein
MDLNFEAQKPLKVGFHLLLCERSRATSTETDTTDTDKLVNDADPECTSMDILQRTVLRTETPSPEADIS